MARAGPTVLVVDDDRDIRDALETVLRFEGYTVQLAQDGQEALDRLMNGQPPNAIVLDLMMPRMNGFEFLVHLRRIGAFKALPVIVHSANRGYSADDLGVFDILRKPATIENILDCIGRAAA